MAGFTHEDLERINRAIAQGARVVQFSDGRRVEFSTIQELLLRRRLIMQELEQSAAQRRKLAEHTKGVRG